MISQGKCAAGGAVDHVKSENGRLTVSTVDGTPAVGVCGSGLVDAVGVLLDEKVINASGKFAKSLPEGTDFSTRLEADKKRFLLSRGKRGGVYITQKDIRKVQLAKSAIATGVELMLEEAGKSVGDIARVYVAGSFGNYITVENAMRIGILPRIAREKITSVGNSSGLGAIEFIIRPELWKEALAVAKGARHIELATHRDFQRTFVKNLSFD
ncbi:ASKHA domain-containing protein [Synergistes jonesii]|uniref:ASKHA domain-containing protein n=1 Tax=Synergistes jonesii TaxID=2754 RepID=UPI0033279E65